MKFTLLTLLGLVAVLSLIASCTKAAPSCGDDRTKKAVLKIAQKKAKENAKLAYEVRNDRHVSDDQWDSLWDKIDPPVQLYLENITTKEFKKDIGTYECSADLSVLIKGKKSGSHITYSSALSADNENRFIIEVRGLGFLVALF